MTRRILRSAALLAGLSALASGCTTSDPTEALSVGLVPPGDIASVGSVSLAPEPRRSSAFAAMPPAPIGSVGAGSADMDGGMGGGGMSEGEMASPGRMEPAVSRAPMAPVSSASLAPPASNPPPARANSARAAVGEIQFLPVVGAPQEKAEWLAGALARGAGSQGITIRPASAPVATLRLKGYFSTVEDAGSTNLVYVWDVLDAQGNRVTRIQGQESVGRSGGDPWAAVGPEVIEAVARKTLSETADLLSRNG